MSPQPWQVAVPRLKLKLNSYSYRVAPTDTFARRERMRETRQANGSDAMNFELTDRAKEYRERVTAFMEEHIYPA